MYSLTKNLNKIWLSEEEPSWSTSDEINYVIVLSTTWQRSIAYRHHLQRIILIGLFYSPIIFAILFKSGIYQLKIFLFG
jgi:hypothetical protein